MFDPVDGFDALQHIFDRVVDRILSGLQCKAFVSHILKRDHFAGDLLLRKLFPPDVLVLAVIRTVGAAVHAVVRQIQRRKHHNAVAVELLLDLLCQSKNPFLFLRQLAFQKHGRLPMRKPFALRGLFQDRVHQFAIVLVLFRVGDGVLNLLIVDEFRRLG